MAENTIVRFMDKKKLILAAFLGIFGVILIILSNCTAKSGKETQNSLENLDPAEYARTVEKRVEELCNKIDGVGSAYAVVSLEGGYRAVYASDVQSGSSNSKKQTVILGSGADEKALLVGYENPRIAGIGIVCSGGDEPRKRADIISVISSAFDVSSNKIFVTGS